MRIHSYLGLIVTLVLSLTLTLNAFEPQFRTRIDYTAPTWEDTKLHVADFDGDGIKDVWDPRGDGLFIMFNSGDGTLRSFVYRGEAEYLDETEIGDLDGDGDIDIITSRYSHYTEPNFTLRVHLNDGSGSFSILSEILLDNDVAGLTAVDMDGDGDLDLIVRSMNTNQAVLWVNDGTGELTPSSTTYQFAQYTEDIDTGDLDEDGDVDLVVGRIMSDSVQVFMNNGDGTLAAPISYYAGEKGGVGVSAVDMNADGHLDIVLAEDSVSVFINQGDGSFGPYLRYNGGNCATSVLTEDLNGDLLPDVVVCRFIQDELSVLYNQGDGTLTESVEYNVSWDPVAVGAVDLNFDGTPDLVTRTRRDLSALINNGDETFTNNSQMDLGLVLSSVVTGDFDGDGNLDLATSLVNANQVEIALSQGDGNFGLPAVYTVGASPRALVARDLDSDGDIDLLSANTDSDDISILYNTGGGTFEPAVNFAAGAGACDIAVADINNDGYLDLCVSDYRADAVSILINDGNNQFESPVSYEMGGAPASITAADFDGDGNVDLATSNSGYRDTLTSEAIPPNVTLRFNQGNGVLGPVVAFSNGGTSMIWASGPHMQTGIESIDIDGDADLDLFVSCRTNLQGVAILLNDGGLFSVDQVLQTNSLVHSFILQDFDNDGDVDLAASHTLRNSISVFTNSGNSEFGSGIVYGTNEYPGNLCAGDINGDGQRDIVVPSYSYHYGQEASLSILYNTGAGGQIATCCGYFTGGITGNIDCSVDGKINLTDITRLIDRVYLSKTSLCCEANGNVDGDEQGKQNLTDITRLIDHVYISKGETAICQ